MPPALLLVRFGQIRWLTLPVPVFLLWPLLLVGWLALGVAWLAVSGWSRPRALPAAMTALRALGELSGTRIDVRRQVTSIYLRFV